MHWLPVRRNRLLNVEMRKAAAAASTGQVVTQRKLPYRSTLRRFRATSDSEVPEIREHHRLNFEEVFVGVAGGNGAVRQMPVYRMTKDGLAELAMSFTGRFCPSRSHQVHCHVQHND